MKHTPNIYLTPATPKPKSTDWWVYDGSLLLGLVSRLAGSNFPCYVALRGSDNTVGGPFPVRDDAIQHVLQM